MDADEGKGKRDRVILAQSRENRENRNVNQSSKDGSRESQSRGMVSQLSDTVFSMISTEEGSDS